MPGDCSILRFSVPRKEFFRCWAELLKPMSRLTDKESDIFAAFLEQRFSLGQVVKDSQMLDKVLMSEDSRRKIREKYNISHQYFYVIMGELRKKGVIVDGMINRKFIPDLSESASQFRLTFSVEMKDEGKG